MPATFLRNAAPLFFGIGAFLVVVLATIGIVFNYTPVPLFDTWNSLNHYTLVRQGFTFSWWSQHSEHRILVGRLIYCLDFKFFGGCGIFLLVLSWLALASGVWILALFLRAKLNLTEEWPADGKEKNRFGLIIISMITALFFSWIQSENLTWTFQIGFFLAYLFPLYAFYFLYRSLWPNFNMRLYILACFFGVCAALTMANGLACLPIICLCSLLTMKDKRPALVPAVMSIVISVIYSIDYCSFPLNDSLMESTLNRPFDTLQFALFNLAGPFHLIYKLPAMWPLALIPAFLILVCASKALKAVKFSASRCPLDLTILSFILYIGASTWAVAGGRVSRGLEFAFYTRYQTPVLMVWAAFLVLCTPSLWLFFKKREGIFMVGAAALLLPLVIYQTKALQYDDEILFLRQTAGLAVAMNVVDDDRLKYIYALHGAKKYEHAFLYAKRADVLKTSVFSRYPFKSMRGNLKKPPPAEIPSVPCSLTLERTEQIYYSNAEEVPSIDKRFVRISGWVIEKDSKKIPKVIRILNQDGLVIGYALSGRARPDLAPIFGEEKPKAGFEGYIYENASPEAVARCDASID